MIRRMRPALLLVTLALGACTNAPTAIEYSDPVTSTDSPEQLTLPLATGSDTVVIEEIGHSVSEPIASQSLGPAPQSGEIRDVDFRNGLVYPNHSEPAIGDLGPVVDGEYLNGEWGEREFYAFFVDEPVFVDLDGDGTDEAVVSAALNGGGSGYFSQLRAIDIENGVLVEVAIEFYGDRAFGGIANVGVASDGETVVVDVFTDGRGACCPDTVVRQRVGVADGQFFVAEQFDPIRYVNLANIDGIPELRLLPGTNEALLGVEYDGEYVIRFQAQAGQLLELQHYAGDGTSAQTVTHIESGVTVDVDGETVLARDGLYELMVGADDVGAPGSYGTLVSVTIRNQEVPSGIGPGLAWEVKQTTVGVDPALDIAIETTVPEFAEHPYLQSAIEEFVDGQIDPWFDNARESDLGDGEVESEYLLYSDVTLNSPDLISIEFEFYEYVCCRPYPNYGYRGLTVEPETGRVLADGDIVDVSRLSELNEIFIAALNTSGVLEEVDPGDVFLGSEDSPAWSALWVAPDGLIFGTDRTGPFALTASYVPFTTLGDLVLPEVVAAAT